MIGEAISNFFNSIMFGIIKMLASITNTIISLMRMLLGLDALQGDGGAGAENLLLSSIRQPAVMWAFITVIALGFVTTFIFALVRITKNYVNDENDDGAVSKRKALKEVFRSMLGMLLIPVFVFALILGVNATAQVIDNATTSAHGTDYGTEIVFSTVTKNDLGSEGEEIYNGYEEHEIYVLTAEGKAYYEEYLKQDPDMYVNYDYLTKLTGMEAVKYYYSGYDYYDSAGNFIENTFSQKYDDFKMLVKPENYFPNFLLPLLGGAIMVCALGMSIVVVAQRIFYSVFLFIISPFIVSTRPLDDGARWRKWCEVFISKLIGAYAIIICLNVFFLLSSYIVQLRFFTNGLANAIAKLVVYISGVIAASGAPQLIAQLIGGDAGQVERDNAQNNFRALAGGAALAKTLGGAASKIASKGSDFFAGKKSSPLSGGGASGGSALSSLSGGGASGGGSVASTLKGDSMASKIGNTLMGRNSATEMGRELGQNIANTRLARGAVGAGMMVAGIATAPVTIGKKISRKVQDAQKKYANKHPDSKTARKVAKRERTAKIENTLSASNRKRAYKIARQMTKKHKKGEQ